MLAVFFLLPQSEQVYVSVSIFEVHSAVTALAVPVQQMPELLWWIGEQAGLSSACRMHPSCVEVLLALGVIPFYSTAGQPDPEESCIFGKTLTRYFFSGYTIALLPVKGWRR